MSKSGLVEHVRASLGVTKAEATRAVDAVADGIHEIAFVNGERVTLNGFGTFSRKHKAERHGRNPRTGEAITTAAHDVLGFKPSRSA